MPPKPSCECGLCRKCSQREWARRNAHKHREYVLANYERVSETKAQWRAANRDRINEQAASYKRRPLEYRAGNTKTLARRKALYATNTGKLTPQPCEVCGDFPLLRDGRRGVWAHHDDYSKPLDVRWLCVVHHGEIHRQLNIASHRDIDDPPFE